MSGLNDYYNVACQQGLAQQQAVQGIQGGIWGGYSYGTSAGTAISYPQYYQPVVIEEQPKKKKRIIVELREEMRNWHGELV